MICLSSDLHHAGLRTGNQRHCDRSEIQIALQYQRRLEAAGVRCTYFVSGRAVRDEWDDLKPLCESPLVELGGHNYSCFQPAWPHRIWKKLGGGYNGPPSWQRRDAQRTIDIIRRRAGRTIRCWRNHMYMHGPHTEQVLAECGIDVCSDGVERRSVGPTRHAAGLWNYPLNVMPDHEHLLHAERTAAYVERFVRRRRWSDDYGSMSYPIDDWTELVLAELQSHQARGVISNLLIHPITMYLCDRFRSFERLLEFLASCETAHMSEIPGRFAAHSSGRLEAESREAGWETEGAETESLEAGRLESEEAEGLETEGRVAARVGEASSC